MTSRSGGRSPHRVGQRCGGRIAHPRPRRGDHVGPSLVDRGRPGSKHHLICDAGGIPLAVALTGGHRNDVTQLIPLVEAVHRSGASVGGPAGGPGSRSPTAATTTTSTGACCAREASAHASPTVASPTAPASADTAGSSNATSPDCTPSSDSAPATNAAPICYRQLPAAL